MRILVTGGAGFIGSHIVDAYIAAGHKVAVIDDLSAGRRKYLHPKAEFYAANIEDASAMETIFSRENPELVNHHAAISSVAESLRDPMPTFRTNVLGTANILRAFGGSRARRKKIIFASTGGTIYGSPKRNPVPESAPLLPLSAYALSKKMGEDLIRFYAPQLDMEYLIFRYGNVYGPRQNPRGEAGVVAIFGGLFKAGGDPVIFGDGKKTRDYVHISDIVRANMLALRKGQNTELNIGWGREVRDIEMFETIAKFFGYQKAPRYAPHRDGEVKRIALNSAKARRVLGWTPRVSLSKGIPDTLRQL